MRDALTDWPVPFAHPMYGWYHILWLCIAVGASVAAAFLARRKKDASGRDSACDKTVLFFGILLLALEVYKQIFCLRVNHPYNWNDFPFQFCSTPMFLMIPAALLKPGRVKEALYKFLAFYGCLAGVSVMFYPTVISEAVYLTMIIHTMIWHVSMIVVGVYVIAARGYGKNLRKELLPGMAVLGVLIALATALNFLLPRLLTGDPWINFFYISYAHGSSLPILHDIYRPGEGIFKWALLLVCYFLAFSLGAALIFLAAKAAGRRKKEAA